MGTVRFQPRPVYFPRFSGKKLETLQLAEDYQDPSASTVNGNPYPANGGHLYHQTNLFRDALVLQLPALITKRFPQGVEIYNYACANGAEPYSIAMGLVSRHGAEKVAQCFPIHAIDLSEALIQENKKGLIPLCEWDQSSHPEFEQFFTRPVPLQGGYVQYETTPLMRRLVDFRAANIVQDIPHLKCAKPCVVLFRNAWYHLGLEKARALARILFQTLPVGSLVVTGATELVAVHMGKPNDASFQASTPNICLKEAGFQIPKDLNPLFQQSHGLIFEKV